MKRTQTQEKLLIDGVLAGKTEKFGELVEPYVRQLRTEAFRHVKSVDAEDIVQQTLLKAYACLAHFRQECAFSTWLVSIARNEIRQHWRRLTYSRAALTRHIDAERSEDLRLRDPSRSVLDHLERQSVLQYVWQLASNLPPSYKAPFELHYVRGMTAEEIGRQLGLTTIACKLRILRARRLVAEWWQANLTIAEMERLPRRRRGPKSVHTAQP